jgi:hypothetical protein
MGEIVSVERKVFGKNTFTNVIDVKFKQLVPSDLPIDSETPATVEKFFEDYDTVFYDIPLSGSNTSHQELVNKSSEYLGISFEEMEEEIRQLREENVALKKQLFSLSNT